VPLQGTMKNFHCDACGFLIYFENVTCGNCGRGLAFAPDRMDMLTIDAAQHQVDSQGAVPLWQRVGDPHGPAYRKCRNFTQGNLCNWLIVATDADPLCVSCRLTEETPDLAVAENHAALARLEAAKRRLLFSLLELRLPIAPKATDPQGGLGFKFLGDLNGNANVLTGHSQGIVTINIAEAHDPERERRRVRMHEPYRTLLGHFRHEVGHYYWDRLIAGKPEVDDFRRLFGDEREDYSAALGRHYQSGPPADWSTRFISAYASAHPWEDWAETWAHFLHMLDTLEIADQCGLCLLPPRPDEPKLRRSRRTAAPAMRSFRGMLNRWLALTYLLNNLNRGLGLNDPYPFVLSPAAVDKLRFVARVAMQHVH
jgi:hypothetical protein